MAKTRKRTSAMVAIGCFAVGTSLAFVGCVILLLWLAVSALWGGTLASQGGARLEFQAQFPPELSEPERQVAMDETLLILQQRLDDADVRKPSVHISGDDGIDVELIGEVNQERIVALLSQRAQLDFRAVDESLSQQALEELVEGCRAKRDPADLLSDTQLDDALADKVPEGTAVLWSEELDETSGRRVRTTPNLVAIDVALTGDQVARSSVDFDQFNIPYVMLNFDDRGSELFCTFTGEHTGDKLAIVLDDVVLSAPVIQEAICGGKARITMGAGPAQRLKSEASDLAIALNSGALPYPLELTSVDIVAPSE